MPSDAQRHNTTNSGGAGSRFAPSQRGVRADDPRLELLRSWLEAVDEHDAQGAVHIARELRKLGLSIVPVAAKGNGGGR